MKNKISIIILSFNTKDLLRDCLNSLRKVKDEIQGEIIVVDNASKDDSVAMVEKEFPEVKLIKSPDNIGFARGNNLAKKVAKGEYILYLNSDTIVPKGTLSYSISYLDKHQDVGAMTCKVDLLNGELDKDTRRSFITPWIGLTHLFFKLDRVFPKSKLFSRYWYGYIPDTVEHEVDVIQGAYFLGRKKILDEVGWFSEDYFLDGEDIDLCWQIRSKGWKIMYCPEYKIIHLKGASKGKTESTNKDKVSMKHKMKFRMAGVNSMEIFYRKRLWSKYPLLLNYIVISGIKFLKMLRIIKLYLE